MFYWNRICLGSWLKQKQHSFNLEELPQHIRLATFLTRHLSLSSFMVSLIQRGRINLPSFCCKGRADICVSLRSLYSRVFFEHRAWRLKTKSNLLDNVLPKGYVWKLRFAYLWLIAVFITFNIHKSQGFSYGFQVSGNCKGGIKFMFFELTPAPQRVELTMKLASLHSCTICSNISDVKMPYQ